MQFRPSFSGLDRWRNHKLEVFLDREESSNPVSQQTAGLFQIFFAEFRWQGMKSSVATYRRIKIWNAITFMNKVKVRQLTEI